MYTPDKHGRADYGSFYQVNNSLIPALTGSEGDDSLGLQDQRFAQLVYTVNPTQLQLSGVVVSTAPASYATVIQTSGAYTWVMKGAPGLQTDADGWQIQQVFTSGGYTRVTWAQGTELFDKIADNWILYTYN